MTIIPIPVDKPCMGVGCILHAKCLRYTAVDGSTPGEAMYTCDNEGRRVWPLFVAGDGREVSS